MNRIRTLRTNLGLNQTELAKNIGISQSTLSYWERGDYEPDNNGLIKLANYFDVSIDYLLGQADDPTAPNKKSSLSGEEDSIDASAVHFTPDTVEVANEYAALPDNAQKNLIRRALKLAELPQNDIANNYEEKRKKYIKNNALPYAAADGQNRNLAEAVALFDKSSERTKEIEEDG